jgi:hypothetical protein
MQSYLLLLASLLAIALISAVAGLPNIAGVTCVLNGVPAAAFVPGLADIKLLFFSAIGRSEYRILDLQILSQLKF